MIKRGLTIFGVFFIFLIKAQTPNNYKIFTGSDYFISYPSLWQLKPSVNGAQAFLSKLEGSQDKYQENVNIIVQDLSSQPLSLDQYTKLSKSQINDVLKDAKIISIKRIRVDNKPADEFIYTANFQGTILKIRSVWLIHNEKAYIITYTALPEKFELYLNVYEKMVNSFKIK